MDENKNIVPYQPSGLIPSVANTFKITDKILAAKDQKLIPYRKGNKWGFCTREKKVVIDCVYDKVSIFEKGVARVVVGESVKYINKDGCVLDNLNKFISEGYYHEGISEFLDKNGKAYTGIRLGAERGLVTKFYEGLSYHILNGKLGFIGSNGEIVIPHLYEEIKWLEWNAQYSEFSEGLGSVRRNGKWGFIDKTGKVVISFLYDDVTNFNDGVSFVKLKDKESFINKKGENVIPFRDDYDFFKYLPIIYPKLSEGLANIKIDGKYGFVNKYGDLVIKNIYEAVRPFYDGFSRVKDKKWGIIDKNGNCIIPHIYDDIGWSQNGVTTAVLNEKYGLIDDHGSELIPFIYEELNIYDAQHIIAKHNSKYGILSVNGDIIVDFDFIFDRSSH